MDEIINIIRRLEAVINMLKLLPATNNPLLLLDQIERHLEKAGLDISLLKTRLLVQKVVEGEDKGAT